MGQSRMDIPETLATQDTQNTTQKKKDEQHGPHQKPRVNPCAREE